MKILQIITRLDRGGSTEDILSSCAYLQNQGYVLTIVYGKTVNPPAELVWQKKSGKINSINLPYLVRGINPFFDFLSLIRIYQILTQERPDIVHTRTSKAGILGRWAAWLCNLKFIIHNSESRIRIVHTPHGHVFYGYYGRTITAIFIMIEKITAIITDKLVALTEGEKNESLAYGVGRPEQWEVIHSGVSLNSKLKIKNEKLLKELNIPEEAIVIGSVGRLDPVKGYKYFIEAIQIINYRLQIANCKFLIVGDGSERKNLESAICNLKLEDKVIFTGWRDDPEEIISIIDIYVQPSVNEGMGMTLVQAQALAKPIVATNVQGIPSTVKDGVTGILVPPKNAQALVAAILRLVQSEEQRKRMGEEGKIWVGELVGGYPRFSRERMFFLLEKLYENLSAKS